MDSASAERWVTISAFVVAAIYGYRRLTEQPTTPVKGKNLLGVGGIPPLGTWATAWGFTFLVVAIIAEAAPGLGGAFAILIATSDFLTNSADVFKDIGKQEKGTSAQAQSQATTAAGQGQAAAGAINPNPAQGGAQIAAGDVTAAIGGLGNVVAHG